MIMFDLGIESEVYVARNYLKLVFSDHISTAGWERVESIPRKAFPALLKNKKRVCLEV